MSNGHPLTEIAFDKLASVAEISREEIDWEAEYCRLYAAWKAAAKRLADMEGLHAFCELAERLSKEVGYPVAISAEFKPRGITFRTWIGGDFGHFVPASEVDTIEELEAAVRERFAKPTDITVDVQAIVPRESAEEIT